MLLIIKKEMRVFANDFIFESKRELTTLKSYRIIDVASGAFIYAG